MILILTWCSVVKGYGSTEEEMAENRNKVREMFQHAFDSYMRYAYPLDELQPLSCTGRDTWGSFSLSLIDSLDTLIVMGNITEFQKAYHLVISQPSFDIDVNTSVFEANIRVVGGLLSAHLLSPHGRIPLPPGWPCEGPLLNMAESLARRLLPAFNTPTGLPYGTVNLRYGVPPMETTVTCVACCSSFVLEFGTLTRLTGDPIFEETALKSVYGIWERRSPLGLPGNHIDVITGNWKAHDFSIGNYIDSYLEYLVKGGALLGRGELIDMFRELLKPILKYTYQSNWFLWVNKDSGKFTFPYFEALDAYWPGLLSLVGELRQAQDTNLNHYMVWKTLGGLPEILDILEGMPKQNYESYHLRPELAESVWYLYRATGNPLLLEIGKNMITAINKTARVECGFATVRNCLYHTLTDRMESYFLAETLKYLYLLFDTESPFSMEPSSTLNITELFSLPGAQHLLHNKHLLKNGCSVAQSGYIMTTEAHLIDVGALHCCKHKWKTQDIGGEGISGQHGCPARPFHSRLELYAASIKI